MKRTNSTLVLLIADAIAITIMCFLPSEAIARIAFLDIGLNDIVKYAISIIIFAFACLIGLFLFPYSHQLDDHRQGSIPSLAVNVISFCIAIAVLLLMTLAEYNATDMLGCLYPAPALFNKRSLVLLFVLCILWLVFYRLLLAIGSKNGILKWAEYGIIVVLLVLVAYRAYAPNAIYDFFNYTSYHTSAYFTYLGYPITEASTSYYGHYAMLMAPYFHLFGFTVQTIAYLQVIEDLVIALCAVLLIRYLSKSFFVRVLGYAAVFASYYFLSPILVIYPQGFPHRIFFLAILTIFALFFLKYRERKQTIPCRIAWLWYIGGFILSSLGFVWSTDSGLVGIVAWLGFVIFDILSSREHWGYAIVSIVCACVGAVLSVVAAWVMVSITNQYVYGGEPVDFSLFMCPLGRGFVEILIAKLPGNWLPWIPKYLLMMFYLGRGILQVFSPKEETPTPRDTLLFYLAIVIMGDFAYFINRSAYFNLHICAVFLIALFIDMVESLRKHSLTLNTHSIRFVVVRGLSLACVFLVAGALTMSLTGIRKTISLQSTYQKMDSLTEELAYIHSNVPDDSIFLTEATILYETSYDRDRSYVYPIALVNINKEVYSIVEQIVRSKAHPLVISEELYTLYGHKLGISSEEFYDLYDPQPLDTKYEHLVLYMPKD